MIKPKLSIISRKEAMRYLGWKGQPLSMKEEEQLKHAEKQVMQYAKPRLCYRIIPMVNGTIDGWQLPGDDIIAHLSGCQQAVIMAVTLGSGIDSLIMRTQITEMALAMFIDAFASAAVENVCNHFENELREEVTEKGYYLTSRFSPGYGDLSLSVQSWICEKMNVGKQIGLSVSESQMLTPLKSVTSFLGISEVPVSEKKRCIYCRLKEQCELYRTGESCEK